MSINERFYCYSCGFDCEFLADDDDECCICREAAADAACVACADMMEYEDES